MRSPRRVIATALAAVFAASLVAAPGAGAVGYKSAGSFSFGAAGFPAAGAIAVDQTSGNVHVTLPFDGATFPLPPGEIRSFTASGSPLAPFGDAVYFGVAVDPTNQNVYSYNVDDMFFANPKISTFTSSGVPTGTPISLEANESFAQISTDAFGNIYYPNAAGDNVQKFSPAGALLQTITGSDGNAFIDPSDVAVDSAGNVYVVDSGNSRVEKFSAAGTFLSVLDSGGISVAVNTATDEVFVGHGSGSTFEIVAYNSTGVETTRFGLGMFGPVSLAIPTRLAVNSSSGRVYATDVGSATSLIQMFDPIALPSPVATEASAVTQTTATLKGTVNPNGDLTACRFEYGTTTSYGQSKACASTPGSGTSPVAASANLTGLIPNTTYHFTLVAENGGGEAEGSDLQFTTLPSKPAIGGESAGSISQHAALLSGTVNPNGAATVCEFEYGPTAAYGTKVPCSSNPGSGSSPVAVSIPALGGLAAGTTYHYRINATNAGGTTNGADRTFATLADTCQTNAALCPPTGGGSTPPPAGNPPKKPLKCKKGFKKKTVKGKKKCVKVKKKKGKKG